jgi:hypothetical protein
MQVIEHYLDRLQPADGTDRRLYPLQQTGHIYGRGDFRGCTRPSRLRLHLRMSRGATANNFRANQTFLTLHWRYFPAKL